MTDTDVTKGTLMSNTPNAAQPEYLSHASTLGNSNETLDTVLQQAREARTEAARLRAGLKEMLRQLERPPMVDQYGKITFDPAHVLYSQTERVTIPRAAFESGLNHIPGTESYVRVPVPDWWRQRAYLKGLLAGNDAQTVAEDLHFQAVHALVMAPAEQVRQDLYKAGTWAPAPGGEPQPGRRAAISENDQQKEHEDARDSGEGPGAQKAEPTMVPGPREPGRRPEPSPRAAHSSPVRSGDTAILPAIPGDEEPGKDTSGPVKPEGRDHGPLALTGSRPGTPARPGDGAGENTRE